MIFEGLKLAMLGMSVVFVFLILLIGCVKFLTLTFAGITAREIELAKLKASKSNKKKKSSINVDCKKHVAIISAAIAKHRANKK